MEDREQAPSFGMIGIHRMTSSHGARLFNSKVPTHTIMRITIRTAVRSRDLSKSWVFGDKVIAQVDLTPAQFAELITSMNVGDGVPCTLVYANGQQIRHEPDRDETEHFTAEFAAKIEGLEAGIQAIRDAAGPKATKAVRDAIDKLARELKANLPFVAKQFDRHIVKRTADAKSEFDAWATHAIQQAGLSALQNAQPDALEGGSDVE